MLKLIVKSKMKNDYLYYKRKDCGIYVRENLIENSLLTKLNNLFELSSIINNNYCITDSNTTEKYNNCKLDHKIRFAVDERIIKDKMNLLDSNELNELWKMTSYETKCNFIGNYIDTITIKEITDSKKKIIKVNLVDLKLKSNKVKELLDLEEKQYIMAFYDSDSKQFGTSTTFDISNAIVNLLERKQIIGRGSNLSVGYTNFSYFLQPWAQEYLNEQLKKENIVVEVDKFT